MANKMVVTAESCIVRATSTASPLDFARKLKTHASIPLMILPFCVYRAVVDRLAWSSSSNSPSHSELAEIIFDNRGIISELRPVIYKH